ncbi:AI-2E family transporter [Alkalimonas sp. MEB108]|uniref:AI-2E family transporter n=1 Tax=Alkalimonas cellulosilytica TaxID=3058395 RepID=A0ABU7J7A4_9GAMM|nr:AI-2E family transporter [Alkalimonas sp. MEB108]MEE2002408.1 AI-2E family transporter [Alkalimonas sp. MEB108]
MLSWLKKWYHHKFSDPQVVVLFLMLLLGFLSIYWLGRILAPLLVAIAFAYLLEWPVARLTRLGLSRTISTSLVVSTFIGLSTMVLMWTMPLFWHQGRTLLRDMPQMIEQGRQYLLELPEAFPGVISTEQVNIFMQSVDERLMAFGRDMLSLSLASIVDLVALMIYLILVPLLVFFMLKDKELLMQRFAALLPTERKLIGQVWQEMNFQIMNYIRGKILEILIVGAVSYAVFALFGLNYPLLLGVLVGFSVLIPYIGAAVVTLPIALVALFQWGFSPQFGYLMLAYAVIQALDGNLLVPLLFSEVIDLHPVYIIVAVLFFGGMFGFWGIFFAIPLASLVKATINAWSTRVQPAMEAAE